MKRWLNFLCLLFFCSFLFSLSPTPDPLIDHMSKNTVRVFYKSTFKDCLGLETTQMSQGTGIIIEATEDSARILSNAHLGHEKPKGIFYALVPIPQKNPKKRAVATKFALSIEKFDIENDLLVFKMEGRLKNWTPITVAEKAPRIGDKIFWSGYKSLDFVPKVRAGLYMESDKEGIYLDPGFYGDSGGGVFNEVGELVGIIVKAWTLNYEHTLKLTAVPLEEIKEFLK